MATDEPLAGLLDRRALRRRAGARSCERGEAYVANGQVGSPVEHDGTITATVQGTRSYRVTLWADDGEIQSSCTCPMGQDGVFCKHAVAVALAWLDQERSDGAAGQTARPAATMDDVRAWLAGQDRDALVEMLMDHAMDDERLRRRLLVKAATQRSTPLNLAAYRRAIDEAVASDGFVHYRAVYDYASGIGDAIDAIEALLNAGHAAEVIELAEYALKAIEEAIGSVDDSDGQMGDLLERLQAIHLTACQHARPDPEALARRLVTWELRTEWDTFAGAAETYAGVLGEAGLAVYRQIVEAKWAAVPSLGPGCTKTEWDGTRFRLTQMMEALARQTGDVEALVAVKTRDLSSAYAYLQIAETYQQARMADLALEWAERGVRAFPERTDARLREFLAAEYHRRGRHDEAMALVWAQFVDSPHLEPYRYLKGHADTLDQWPTWRSKALEVIRQLIATAKRKGGNDRWAWSHPPDHSDLVRIFLWEHDIDAAWREANEGGCSNDLWKALAAQRERDHPEDALPIYQRQIEPTLNRKNNDAYEEAVDYLRKVRELMTRLGRTSEFPPYLASIRAAHKPKRNFMKLLDRVTWA